MDLVCPLDFRYGRAAMKAIWTEEARLRYLLQVEAALAWAHSESGTVPKDAAQTLQKVADTPGLVSPDRVKEIEAEIKHDLMAVVKAMGEAADKLEAEGAGKAKSTGKGSAAKSAGKTTAGKTASAKGAGATKATESGHGGGASRFIHLGATSYDTIDTANSLQFRDAIALVRDGLRGLRDALLQKADAHRHTTMLGRTHGQAAVPITFGLKMAVFASEVGRHLERLAETEKRISVGMMSGATGSMAAFRGKGIQVQAAVCRRLGLKPVTASTQIIQRDRYVELFSLLANIATSLEKFATEVRTLQRTEIGEVAEGFDAKKQVGSSTMPHKQNPITSEQVSGLARLVRSMVLPTWENAIQWNERDLANSAPERFLHPHAFILVDHCIHQMAKVFRELTVHADRMAENMERAQGLMMAESVMISLTEKGMGRQEAHEVARQAAMVAIAKRGHYRDALLADKSIVKMLGKKGIVDACDPSKYTGPVDDIIDRVIAETQGL